MKTLLVYLLLALLAAAPTAAEDILRFNQRDIYPKNLKKDSPNTNSAQGIAFDGSNWYYSENDDKTLYKLNRDFTEVIKSFSITGSFDLGVTCDHVGGIDYSQNEIFVALEECETSGVTTPARILVFNSDLVPIRTAKLSGLQSAPWVTIDPIDDDCMYVRSDDKQSMLCYPRKFNNEAALQPSKSIRFIDDPNSLLKLWSQGVDISKSGLIFRVVDAKESDSPHTGIWIYQRDLLGKRANRIGFIHLPLNATQWGGFRDDELQDIDVTTIVNIADRSKEGDIHLLKLNNNVFTDQISIIHYDSQDLDYDGVTDVNDNCLKKPNPDQTEKDKDGIGFGCDLDDTPPILPAPR